MVFVWYPIGVAKLVDAAKVIATKNGRGSTCMDDASDSAIGARITAEALFDITSVNMAATRYNDARTTRGPEPARGANMD